MPAISSSVFPDFCSLRQTVFALHFGSPAEVDNSLNYTGITL